MKKISVPFITQTYDKMKRLAKKAIQSDDFEASLRYISAAADLAYNFNWIYVDPEFEKMIVEISSKIIIKKKFKPQNNHIVFYDVFALDNKGLTQQYVRALMNSGAELLFIYEGDNLANSKNIVKELSIYPKVELFTVDSKLSQLEKIKVLYDKIIDFQPEKAFLHLKPSSATAVCLWNALPQTIRYIINITDHAFWLGTSCIDFSIEFRNYGYTVSFEKRGLSRDQLLFQPYYPITECNSFNGFPVQVTPDNIVILTGGAFYKMYGENDIFFGILKKLLDINLKVIILIAGSGNAKPLNDFIETNNLHNRLFLIGNRVDINSVFKRCDIYLNTYPLGGGLMVQLAAVNSKPILSYTSSEISDNFVEGILNWGDTTNLKVTHTTLDSFFQDAKKLIYDTEYRIERGKILKRHIISAHEFNTHFNELTSINKNKITPTLEIINYDNLTIKYLETENNYLFNFYSLIISHFKFSTFIHFPIIGFNALLSRKIMFRVLNIIIKNFYNSHKY